jgi:hypothetical protein
MVSLKPIDRTFLFIYNILLRCHAVTLVTLKTKVLHGTRPREYFGFQRDIA